MIYHWKKKKKIIDHLIKTNYKILLRGGKKLQIYRLFPSPRDLFSCKRALQKINFIPSQVLNSFFFFPGELSSSMRKISSSSSSFFFANAMKRFAFLYTKKKIKCEGNCSTCAGANPPETFNESNNSS